MVNHPNRKKTHVALTPLERRALVGVLEEAIARMQGMNRDPKLLLRIREKVLELGD
jgi:hypothetical protein